MENYIHLLNTDLINIILLYLNKDVKFFSKSYRLYVDYDDLLIIKYPKIYKSILNLKKLKFEIDVESLYIFLNQINYSIYNDRWIYKMWFNRELSGEYETKAINYFYLIRTYEVLPEILKLEWPDYYLKWYVINDIAIDIKNKYKTLDNYIKTLNNSFLEDLLDLIYDVINEYERIIRIYIYLVMNGWTVSYEFEDEIKTKVRSFMKNVKYDDRDEYESLSISELYCKYICDTMVDKLNIEL